MYCRVYIFICVLKIKAYANICVCTFVPFRSNTTQSNLLFQPIDPIFRSHHPEPHCLIYVIVVQPELTHQYEAVLDYTEKSVRFSSPKLLTSSAMKPRHKYFSYFGSTLITIFSNNTDIYAKHTGKTVQVFRQAVFLIFHITKKLTQRWKTVT